ncbi:unnamed protein product [Trichobilharzia szidati]|nr:unnamed protein product [Trichobilharzia szidati]
MIYLVIYAVTIVLVINADNTPPTSNYPIQRPHLDCNITQQGFHLRLRCDFHNFPEKSLETCQLHVHLPSGFYIDPYELASNQPKLNFSISKSVNHNENSRIDRFVKWLTNANKKTDSTNGNNNEVLSYNQVDIEAPEWLSQPLTYKFHTNHLEDKSKSEEKNAVGSLDIPIHLRYHLPLTKSEELKNTEPTTEIKHPTLNCPDGSNSHIVGKNDKDYFPVIVPKPKASDLIYVMPITILLLVIGVVVLLMA